MILIKNTDKTSRSNILKNLLKEIGYASIEEFQRAMYLTVDGLFGMKSYTALYNRLLDVELYNFEGYYFKEAYEKRQFIWHHGAGRDNARGMFEWWKIDNVTHVATAAGVTDSGKLSLGFDERHWAASIGCGVRSFMEFNIPITYEQWYNHKKQIWQTISSNNRNLDRHAVAIEICNWGQLSKRGDKYYSWANTEVPADKVIEIPFRNARYFERYTSKEIETLKYWTLLNAMRFDIPLDYNEVNMWEVNKDALSGKPGLYTHCSYRHDKTDVYPHPELITMAKSLNSYTLCE